MTNEQYVEVINRVTQYLLNSKKEYKKVYNSDIHGTKSDYIKVKQTGDKYETGLLVLSENTNTPDGKAKPGLSTYVLDNNGNRVKEEIVNGNTGEVTYGDYKKMPDSDLMDEVSNTGLALTVAYAMANEISIIRDYYDKKVSELWDEAKRLQKEIDNLRSDTTGGDKTINSEIEKLKSRVATIESKIK